MDNRKSIAIRLRPELWKQAKIQAAIESKTLQVFIEEIIENRLNKTGEK
jgi:predicted DNA-binding protein